jgi:hypothetical protein
VVDISDVILLSRSNAEDQTAVISALGKVNADCSGDGKLTSEDVVMILKAIAKLITL